MPEQKSRAVQIAQTVAAHRLQAFQRMLSTKRCPVTMATVGTPTRQRSVDDPVTLRDILDDLRLARHLPAGVRVLANGRAEVLVDPVLTTEDGDDVPVPGRLLLLDERVWKQMVLCLEQLCDS